MIARDIYYNSAVYSSTNSNYDPSNGYSNNGYWQEQFDFNDRQSGLKTTYHSPYSISFGAEYQLNKTTFAFSGEYFGPVQAYNLATPVDSNFLRPIWFNKMQGPTSPIGQINSNVYLRILEASQSVTNFAIAIEQKVSSKLDIDASFRTDFTSYQKASNDFWEYQNRDSIHPPGIKLSFSNINLFHLTLGVVLKNKKSDIHLGVSYSFGNNPNFQPLNNIANPNNNPYVNLSNNLGAIPNYNQPATYTYNSLSLLLGYTYHLK